MNLKLKKEAKIGLFGVLMIAVLYWGINFLKGRDIFMSTRSYYAVFNKADGLQMTTEILLKGVKIGSVTDISYNPALSDKVVVKFSADKEYKIPIDSRIVASNKYIIGGTVLNLEYGTATEFFRNNDTIPALGPPDVVGMATNQLEDIKEKATLTVNNINQTLEGVNALLSQQNIDNISAAIASLNRIVSTDLRATIRNLNTFSGTLNDNSCRIDNIISNVEQISDSLRKADVAQIVSKANITLDAVNSTIAKINAGEGSAGKLVNDNALYDSLVTASHNLSILLEDIKVNPRRYINISVFGGGKNKK